MRHHLTETEQALWRQLSGSKLGVAFRRQVPVGRYIADFMAPSLKLIIEYHGECHPIEHIFYKWFRCQLVHEGELSIDIEFIPDGESGVLSVHADVLA
jgi:very-short-patch-repair endonuclease